MWHDGAMSANETRLRVTVSGLLVAGFVLTLVGGGAAFIASKSDDILTPTGLVLGTFAGVMLAIGLAILVVSLTMQDRVVRDTER